jgi:protocatechuate 3,4-dioxygenase beta subunit
VLLRVLDAKGRPFPGARVSLNRPIPGMSPYPETVEGLMTDAAGEVRLTPRLYTDGNPYLTIQAEGYLPEHWSLELLPGERRRVDVKLKPFVTVSGRVVDTRGQPVPNLHVVGRSDWDSEVSSSATTDAKGHFSLPNLIPGPVSVTMSLERSPSISERVVAPRADVEWVWKPSTSTLGVQVRDERGEPLPRAIVVPVQPVSGQWVSSGQGIPLTDAEGKIEFDLLPPVPLHVSALWDREGTAWVTSREVSLAAGQRHSVELSFEGSRVRPPLTGRVTDEQGRPVPGVTVVATPGTSPGPGELLVLLDVPGYFPGLVEWSRTDTDAEGRFTLKGLRGGPVWVQAAAPRGLFDMSAPVEAPPGRDEVSLVLPRKSTLSGTVVDPQGKPVEDFRVRAGSERSSHHRSGRFEDVVVPEGPSLITLIADGFAEERRPVEVPARSALRLEEPIVLQPERKVRGRVVKEDGCTPIPRAVVMLDRGEPGMNEMGDALSSRAGAEGRFTLGRLKREPLVLRVAKYPFLPWGLRGGVPQVSQPVTAGEDSVTVRFGPEASLTGVVTDGEGRPLSGGLLLLGCTWPDRFIDAAGRYVVHGLEGGQECILSVDARQEAGAPVFTPKRVVLPSRGMLRVDLAARRGPAAVKVSLPSGSVSAALLEGEVPMPETWRQSVQWTQEAMRPDPGLPLPGHSSDAPVELLFSQLSPGRYTLLVSWPLPKREVAMVRVPVTLDGPGTTRVEVDLDGARIFKKTD